ncbi:MAG TPA: hypothetical protein DCS97_06480 [Planctomycetes bacterium]|nr:hypothetical protein [Planctomycetota bacterium]
MAGDGDADAGCAISVMPPPRAADQAGRLTAIERLDEHGQQQSQRGLVQAKAEGGRRKAEGRLRAVRADCRGEAWCRIGLANACGHLFLLPPSSFRLHRHTGACQNTMPSGGRVTRRVQGKALRGSP